MAGCLPRAIVDSVYIGTSVDETSRFFGKRGGFVDKAGLRESANQAAGCLRGDPEGQVSQIQPSSGW